MTDLRQVQQALHDFLQGKSNDIEKYVVGKSKTEVKRRLHIYQEAYQLRLQENLRKQFPQLFNWLGNDKFVEIAKGYDEQFPPKDYAIRQYGAAMPVYLKSIGENCLAELAQFEWAMNVALDDSAEKPLLTTEDFQKLSPEALMAMKFEFNPSLQALTFHHDIANFWQAIKKNAAKALPAYAENPYHYVIWRKAYLPYYLAVEALEWQLFDAARNQANFTDLCELAEKSMGEQAAATVAGIVLRWLQNGWLVSG